MDWKNLLGSVSASVNDELRLRIAYLTAENRILRQQIKGRGRLSNHDRKALGEIGRRLGRKALAEIATVTQPDTIVAWGRKFADKQVDCAKPRQSVGRPRVDKEIEDLVIRMARENRSWGYDRMQGALKHLGYSISDQTVGNILKRNVIPPAPQRKETMTWREFVRIHLDVLGATDFFNSNVWRWFGLMISSLFCFIHFSRDQVYAMVAALHGPIQHMRSFGRRALDWRNYVQSWDHWERQTSQRSEGIPVSPVSPGAPSGPNVPRSQDLCQVVVLSDSSVRRIRDGPMQRRHLFDRLLKDDWRQAA